MQMRAPEGVHRMVKRPRPRTPGSVSQMSFRLALALLVATSISRAVITPARVPLFRVVRSAVAAAVSVAVSVAVPIASTYPYVDPISGPIARRSLPFLARSSETLRHASGQNIEISR
jgi:hypothetical protein